MNSEDQDTRHFLEYWQVLRSRKEIVIGVMLMVVVAGVLVTISLPKVYMASTRMTVTRVVADVPVFENREADTWYNPFYLKTQLEIVRSQTVMDRVIENLGLHKRFAGNRAPMSLSMARKELLSSVRVQPYLDTNIIKVDVYRRSSAENAEETTRDVAEIANMIAEVYREESTETVRDKTRKGMAALSEEYMRYEKLVTEKEKDVEAMRVDLGVLVYQRYRGESDITEKTRIQHLETRRMSAQAEMLDRRTRLEKITNFEGDDVLYLVQYLMKDPNLGSLRREWYSTKLRMRELEESLGPKHPDVLRNKAIFNELNLEIKDAVRGSSLALETDYEIAKMNYEEVTKELDEERRQDIERSADKYLPFQNAELDLAKLRSVRDRLHSRLIEEKIELDLPQTPVKVIDRAEKPGVDEYVSPIMLLNIALSLLLGVVMGVGIAFVMEYADTSIRTIEDIERHLGIPVVGVIPQKVKALTDAGEDSVHAESYRLLRTNLQFSKLFKDGKTLCITSGGAGEGKSFTISNLAFVSAQMGDKVIIVDSDLRRPKQHRIFNVARGPGLAEVLRGEVTLDEAIIETQWPNLFLLVSGNSSSNSAGLLDTQRMSDVIDELKGRYDMVALDAPPIIGVSDASVLVSKADGVLMVVQYRGYPRHLSARARKLVENVGGKIVGVVLNKINISRDYGYYYDYQSYYKTDGEQGDDVGAGSSLVAGKGHRSSRKKRGVADERERV
jgi:capsular exopolysaccharide synthesis family protein